jgi:hypothetical protein
MLNANLPPAPACIAGASCWRSLLCCIGRPVAGLAHRRSRQQAKQVMQLHMPHLRARCMLVLRVHQEIKQPRQSTQRKTCGLLLFAGRARSVEQRMLLNSRAAQHAARCHAMSQYSTEWRTRSLQ